MRKYLSWLVVILILGIGVLVYSPSEEEHIHYHAGFVVYIDGEKQDYSDYKYMNFKSCTEEKSKPTKEELQIEKAHLHDGVDDVVHVEQAGAVWGDLFKNIGVEFSEDLPEINKPIEADSSVVFSVGKPVDNPEKVSIEHIKEVEAKSELCGSAE